MRLLDPCGRLLGRWNIIDVSAGLLVAAAVSFGTVAINVTLGRWRQQPMLHRILPVDLLVTFTGVDEATAKRIRVGDVEQDADGWEVARIEEILEAAPETLVVRFGDRDWVKRLPNPSSGFWDVSVRLRVTAELRGDSLFYKDRQLQSRILASSASFGFSTPDYTLRGMVYDEGWITLRIITEPMPLTQVRRLRSGQVEVSYDGKPLARLLQVADTSPFDSAPPAEPPAASPPPKAQQAKSEKASTNPPPDPLVNATLHLEARCRFHHGQLLFKGKPVSEHGPALPFNFDGMLVEATVDAISSFKPVALSSEVPRS
ncbi:MAG: DUF4330 family protein [Candidatus Omnitrophica bacterium]|nr:DUF4330 family protein [Candidatus Omnitrophota bacterium]